MLFFSFCLRTSLDLDLEARMPRVQQKAISIMQVTLCDACDT